MAPAGLEPLEPRTLMSATPLPGALWTEEPELAAAAAVHAEPFEAGADAAVTALAAPASDAMAPLSTVVGYKVTIVREMSRGDGGDAEDYIEHVSKTEYRSAWTTG